jgi:N-acetylmuramoyl-L-alanine amidase
MQAKDFIIGTLKHGGYLRTESGEILLTRIPRQAARSPESAALEIAPQDVGKMALVRGDLSGNVLYSADVIEILSSVTSILFKTLLNKGVVSLEEFQKQLSELESKETETQEKKRLCALVIGHKKHSPGAVNASSNLSEFDFNEDLALRIEGKIQGTDIQRIYRRTYKELPDDINALDPDFIVSLHCNAFNGKVSGTEVLYYHKSEKGKDMAGILLNHLVEHLKLPDRGVKPRSAEDRGGYLLRYTNAPCVISEPFFIDNGKDLARVQEDMDGLVAAYAAAIDEISQEVV